MKTTVNSTLVTKNVNNNYTVTLNNTNKLNIINAYKIENKLMQLVKESGIAVFLDLTEINFIDSTGFSILLKIQRTAYLNNVRFIIYNVNEEALELFDLLGLNNEFEIRNIRPLYSNLKKAS